MSQATFDASYLSQDKVHFLDFHKLTHYIKIPDFDRERAQKIKAESNGNPVREKSETQQKIKKFRVTDTFKSNHCHNKYFEQQNNENPCNVRRNFCDNNESIKRSHYEKENYLKRYARLCVK